MHHRFIDLRRICGGSLRWKASSEWPSGKRVMLIADRPKIFRLSSQWIQQWLFVHIRILYLYNPAHQHDCHRTRHTSTLLRFVGWWWPSPLAIPNLIRTPQYAAAPALGMQKKYFFLFKCFYIYFNITLWYLIMFLDFYIRLLTLFDTL